MRPKDLENPYMDIEGHLKFTIDTPDIAYDKGASAMVEGLKSGSGFKCSVMGVTPVYDGSTTSPLQFSIAAQSVVEEKDGATYISLPNFNLPEYQTYPPRKGYLVFIPEEE